MATRVWKAYFLEEELVDAVKSDDLPIVGRMLSARAADAPAETKQLQETLEAAVHRGHWEIAQMLWAADAAVLYVGG